MGFGLLSFLLCLCTECIVLCKVANVYIIDTLDSMQVYLYQFLFFLLELPVSDCDTESSRVNYWKLLYMQY